MFIGAHRFVRTIWTEHTRCVLVEDERCRVREGHQERAIGAEQSMRLAKNPTDIVDRRERVHGDDCVETVRGKKGEFCQVAVMNFHMYFGYFGCHPNTINLDRVGIDRHNPSPLASECDRRSSSTAAKIENSLTLDFTKQSAIETIGVIRP